MGMNSKGKPRVSLVIPAYNEEDHILEVLERAICVMSEMGVDYEVILVNDGSTDATGFKSFEYMRNNFHLKVISYRENKGKGYAVRAGFFSAVGDSVVSVSYTHLTLPTNREV